MKNIVFAFLVNITLTSNVLAEIREGVWEGLLVGVYGHSSYFRLYLDEKGGSLLQASERMGPEVIKFSSESITVNDDIYRVYTKEPFKDGSGYFENTLMFTIDEPDDDWMPSRLRGSIFMYWSGKEKKRRTSSVSSYDLTEIKNKSLVERINEGISLIEGNANQ